MFCKHLVYINLLTVVYCKTANLISSDKHRISAVMAACSRCSKFIIIMCFFVKFCQTVTVGTIHLLQM